MKMLDILKKEVDGHENKHEREKDKVYQAHYLEAPLQSLFASQTVTVTRV
jgi:hypothetical protein